MSVLLEIKDLHVAVNGKEILKGINLIVKEGETHAIMGPNGSGKSTLAQVLAGRESYTITRGEILYKGKDLQALSPEERAREGLFLGFQYPVEVPGVTNAYFLKAAVNARRKHRGEPELDSLDFLKLIKQKIQCLQMDQAMLNRPLNEGFSGGEKKRNEILQMMTLEPKLAVLDETDSGLDIDALKIVARGINSMRSKERSFLLITHYQRLLQYVVPDQVHVLLSGQLVQSGDQELAQELEAKGYAELEKEIAAGSC